VDSSYYLRQEKHGFNLGPYERGARAHWADPADPMPDDFSFQLFPDDLDRLEWYIQDACARVPLLAKGGVSRVINGPIPYAPDGLPLIGPMPGVPDAYEACVFTFGIVQAGGAGKVLAEWVTEGATEWDMWAVDPRRFTAMADDTYARVKAIETYGHEYAMHFPHGHWPAGRDRRLSPLHARLKAAGAVMAPFNGWERADWFAKPGDDLSWDATQTWDRAGPWEPRIKAECQAVRDGCGVLAISGFTRLAVDGPGARDFVDSLTCSKLPPVGRVGLAYFCDQRGRVVTEMSVMNEGPDRVGLITAAVAQWHDAEWLWRQAPPGVTVSDHADAVECLLVTGPRARDVLGPLTDGDLTKPWLSIQTARVAGSEVGLLRVSFAGELGWELHCATADAPAIWDAVTGAGATPFGMKALDRLRLEKGWLGWKAEISTDYSALELGLSRFIDMNKPFPGIDALAAPTKRLVTLVLDDPGDCDAPYMSNIWVGDRRVGETLSGGYGYRVAASLSLAMVANDAGDRVEVEAFGLRRPARVVTGPVWDPTHQRIRA
jgi:dimethylglycine dehydrogenase